VDEYCVCHLATGDMLRAAVSTGSEMGRKAKEVRQTWWGGGHGTGGLNGAGHGTRGYSAKSVPFEAVVTLRLISQCLPRYPAHILASRAPPPSHAP
jgi:hypothetical protein